MIKSTYIQKLVVGDIITGIEKKSIYKVITPRKIEIDHEKNTQKLVNDKEIHNWHFVNKSFKDFYNQLTKLLVKLRKNNSINKKSYWLLSTKIINIYCSK